MSFTDIWANAIALSQIAECLKESKNGMALAQMSVKLMSPGAHRKADIVGMIMAQLSMKAAIKKWGERARFAILKEMKQLHWCNSYKPKHWRGLTKKQKKQILESHVFVKERRMGPSRHARSLVATSNETTSPRRMLVLQL